jgi:hypothetical protein
VGLGIIVWCICSENWGYACSQVRSRSLRGLREMAAPKAGKRREEIVGSKDKSQRFSNIEHAVLSTSDK